MSERLSDERLRELDDIANCRLPKDKEEAGYRLDGVKAIQVRDDEAKRWFATLVAELRARRAADLSADELADLRAFRECLNGSQYTDQWKRALTLLDKLIAGAKP